MEKIMQPCCNYDHIWFLKKDLLFRQRLLSSPVKIKQNWVKTIPISLKVKTTSLQAEPHFLREWNRNAAPLNASGHSWTVHIRYRGRWPQRLFGGFSKMEDKLTVLEIVPEPQPGAGWLKEQARKPNIQKSPFKGLWWHLHLQMN